MASPLFAWHSEQLALSRRPTQKIEKSLCWRRTWVNPKTKNANIVNDGRVAAWHRLCLRDRANNWRRVEGLHKKSNKSYIHTPTENNTPDTHTHTHTTRLRRQKTEKSLGLRCPVRPSDSTGVNPKAKNANTVYDGRVAAWRLPYLRGKANSWRWVEGLGRRGIKTGWKGLAQRLEGFTRTWTKHVTRILKTNTNISGTVCVRARALYKDLDLNRYVYRYIDIYIYLYIYI